ncbi:MAG: hypothetical protein H0V17_32235, partial [Deltaproteobacteria bacterium]|nr:hypothetical protein [Deltaproteobacteria bacterium]
GRRGRFAVTLRGGGVLIEGDGEVTSSSRTSGPTMTPSVIHGRVGMTIRFGDLDDDSKTVLIELEKARLVAKPPAPSVSPRIAELPATPRPVPPAPSARMDASITLAECVAIGDLVQLEKLGAPPKAGPKFVMPSVLPVGTPRPKTPSTPPELRPRTPSGQQPVVRPKTPSVPPPMPSLSPLPKQPSGPMATAPGGFSATMPAVSLADLRSEMRAPLEARTTQMTAPAGSTAQIMNAVSLTPTTMAAVGVTPTSMTAVTLTPTEMSAVMPPDLVAGTMTPTQMAAVPPPPNGPTATITTSNAPAPTPMAASAKDQLLMTQRGVAPAKVAARAPAEPVRGAKRKLPDDLLMTMRDSRPPVMDTVEMPPLTPAPPIVAEAKPAIVAPDLDEPTDLTGIPVAPGPVGRATSLGVAVIPRGALVLPAETMPGVHQDLADGAPVAIEDFDTSVTEQPSDALPPPVAAAAGRKPTIEEATPSGDWTITTGAAGPTIEPRNPVPTNELEPVPQVEIDLKPKAPTRVTGDWTIQLDDGSPDGWSEPSRADIAKLPDEALEEKPKLKAKIAKPRAIVETPPELAPVARSIVKETAAMPAAEPVTASAEPKVQIDPTLMDGPIVDPNFGAPPSATLSALFEVPQPPSDPPQHARLATPIPGSVPRYEMTSRPTPMPPTRSTPIPSTSGVFDGANAPSPAELASLPSASEPRLVTDGGVGFFRESGEIGNLAGSGSFPVGDSTSLVEVARRRRLIVIVVSAGLAVAIGIALVIAFAGGTSSTKAVIVTADASVGPGSVHVNHVVATPDAAEAPPPLTPDASAAAAEC